jgi:hypothetical protein
MLFVISVLDIKADVAAALGDVLPMFFLSFFLSLYFISRL